MEIKLLSLELINFKGIKHFKLDLQGRDATVYGDNAKGKTSLLDAHTWIFTGKNSEGKADFNIKDITGKIPDGGIDHTCKEVWLIDGHQRTFERTFHEVYAGKRGINLVLKGHTTEYRIDGEGMPEARFNDAIKELFPGQLFQILSDPFYFNSLLAGTDKSNSWKTRREMLFKWYGECSDAEIIASNPELKDYPIILDGKTHESRRKIIKDAQNEAEKEAEGIPGKIDENEKMKPDVSGLKLTDLQTQLQTANQNIAAKQAELSRLRNGDELTQQKFNLRQIDLDLAVMGDNWKSKLEQEVVALENQKTKLSAQSMGWQNDITSWELEIKSNKSDIDKKNTLVAFKTREVVNFHEKYTSKLKEEFIFDPSPYETQKCECPVCYRELDSGAIDNIRIELEKQFNIKHSNEAEAIKAKALEIKAEVDSLKKEIAELESANTNLETKIAGNNALIDTQKADIESVQLQISTIKDRPVDTQEYHNKLAEKVATENKISQLESGENGEAIEKTNQEIARIEILVQSIKDDIAKFKQIENNDKRINELSKRQRELADQIQRYEKQLHIMGLFTRRKCEMLSDNINKHFKVVKWELFKILVNGETEEKCEASVKGVPYSDLNLGSKINAGMDIINAISEVTGLILPVFVDNAESITDLLPTKSQVIRLVKPEIETEEERQKYSKLVVKVQENKSLVGVA